MTETADTNYKQLATGTELMDQPNAEVDHIARSLSRLPIKDPGNVDKKFHGRDEILGQLSDWWRTGKANLVTLVSDGGYGKTAIVREWLEKSRNTDTRGELEKPDEVFVWSFYNQGQDSVLSGSSDLFLTEALKTFRLGEQVPLEAYSRGRLLGEAIGKQRSIFVLDGLETLQERVGVRQGALRELAIHSLLKELAAYNHGMCIVTSRERLTEFNDGESLIKTHSVGQLNPTEGARLLEDRGVHGPEDELIAACSEYGNRPLALVLLGHYIRTYLDGDINRRNSIPPITSDKSTQHWAPLLRIIQAEYSSLGGLVQQHLLLLFGFFDRPAEQETILSLIGDAGLPALSPELPGLKTDSVKQLQTALRPLLASELLHYGPRSVTESQSYDCHPYVRQFLSKELSTRYIEAHKEGHRRLFNHYAAYAKDYPDNSLEMAPLYQAVQHGCQCGSYKEALEKIYKQRIHRGKEFYSIKMLGSYSDDLSIISLFFNRHWDEAVPGLRVDQVIYLQYHAAIALRATRNLDVAIQAFLSGYKLASKTTLEKYKAMLAGELCLSHLMAGDVQQGVEWGERAVEKAKNVQDDIYESQRQLAFYATALHRNGRLSEALEKFEESERIQKTRDPNKPFLYYIPGYLYCELLMDLGRIDEAVERAEWMKTTFINQDALAHGIARFVLGWAYLAQYEKKSANRTADENKAYDKLRQYAQENLASALETIRRLGVADLLVTTLRLHGYVQSLLGALDTGLNELKQAREIAKASGMKLFITEVEISMAMIYRNQGDAPLALKHLYEASKLAKQQHYVARQQLCKTLEKEIHRMSVTPPPNTFGIEPWSRDKEPDYKIESQHLGDIEKRNILDRLTRYGIVCLRISALEPGTGPLSSLTKMIGAPTETQNAFEGWAKNIQPHAGGAPGGGETAGDLGLHVDGTQHHRQPPILIFQYISPAKAGADSVFIDIAQALDDIPENDRNNIILDLSRSDAATFRKGSLELTAPIFTDATGYSLGCRLRFDDILEINEKCRKSYEQLREQFQQEKYQLRFHPLDGDFIVFDNWRLMHARDEVFGQTVRQHNRVWIDGLNAANRERCFLGVRPIDIELLVKVRELNRQAS